MCATLHENGRHLLRAAQYKNQIKNERRDSPESVHVPQGQWGAIFVGYIERLTAKFLRNIKRGNNFNPVGGLCEMWGTEMIYLVFSQPTQKTSGV